MAKLTKEAQKAREFISEGKTQALAIMGYLMNIQKTRPLSEVEKLEYNALMASLPNS